MLTIILKGGKGGGGSPGVVRPARRRRTSRVPARARRMFSCSTARATRAGSLPGSIIDGRKVLVSISTKAVLTKGSTLGHVIPTSVAGVFAILMTTRGVGPRRLSRLIAVDVSTASFDCDGSYDGAKCRISRRMAMESLFCKAVLPSKTSSTISLTACITNSRRTFISVVGRRLRGVKLSRAARFAGYINVCGSSRCDAPCSVTVVLGTTVSGSLYERILKAQACAASGSGPRPSKVAVSG